MLRDLLVEIGIDVDSGPLKKLNAEIDALERKLRNIDSAPVERLERKFNDVNQSVRGASRSISDMDQRVGRLGRSVDEVDSGQIADGFQRAQRELSDLNSTMTQSVDSADSFHESIANSRRETQGLHSNLRDVDRTSWTIAGTFRRTEESLENIRDLSRDTNNQFRRSDGSTGNTGSDMARLSESMDGLRRELESIHAELDRINEAASGLSRELGSPSLSNAVQDSGSIGANMEGAERSARGLGEQIRHIDRLQRRAGFARRSDLMPGLARRTINKIIRGFDRIELSALKAAQFVDKMLAPWDSLSILLPALIPVVAGLATVVGNLGPMIGAVTGGLIGTFGLVGGAAVAGLGGLIPILGNINRFNELDPKKDKHNPEQQAVRDSLDGLSKNYESLLDKTQKPVLEAYKKGIDAANQLMVSLEPMFIKVSNMAGDMMDSIVAGLNSDKGKEVIKYLNDEAANLLGSLSRSMGNIVFGLMSFIKSIDPLTQFVATGLENLTSSFLNWADALGESDGFKRFVDYTVENLPKIGEIFGNLTVGLVNFFAAFGPSASDMMTYLADMTGRFREWAADLGNNTSFQAFLDYVKEQTPKMLELIGSLAEVFKIIAPVLADVGSWALSAANGLLGFAKEHPGFTKFLTLFTLGLIGLGIIFNSIISPLAGVLSGFARFLALFRKPITFPRLPTWLGGTPRTPAPVTPRAPTPPPPPVTPRTPRTRPVPTPPTPPVPRTPPGPRIPGGLGTLTRGLGVISLIGSGASIASSVSNGDYNSAGRTATSTATGAGGAWAGAATGAALGSVVPGIGTAIGGVVGGLVGGIGGSVLGGKLYDGIRGYDWGGLKGEAKSTGGAVEQSWNGISNSFQAGTSSSVNSLGLLSRTTGTSMNGINSTAMTALSGLPLTAGTQFGGMNTAAGTSLGLMNGTVSGSLLGLNTIASDSLGGLASTATTSLGGMNTAITGEFAQVGNSIVQGIQQTVILSKLAWLEFIVWMNTSMSVLGNVSTAGFASMGSGIMSMMVATVSGAKAVWMTFISGMVQMTAKLAAFTSQGFTQIRTVVLMQMAATKSGALMQGTQMASGLLAAFSRIRSGASSAFAGVRTAIVSQMSAARNNVSSIASSIERRITQMNSRVIASNAKAAASGGKPKGVMGSHATGLGRVPFNGYVAELHKNEAVITANQANALRKSGILKGDGRSPQMNMSQATADAAVYNPLGVDPGSTMNTSTTNNSGTVKAQVTINVDGSQNPQSTAVSIKEELEGWFGSLSTVFPANMEG